MPDIAINPLPTTTAAKGNVAAQNNETAHDMGAQGSFGATLAREIQDQRDANSAVREAADTKKRDPVPDAPAADASIQAMLPPDYPPPALTPAAPPDPGALAANSAAREDTDSSQSSPGSDLIPVMLAMERSGIAATAQAPAAGSALAAGSPEGDGLRLEGTRFEGTRLAAMPVNAQPESGSKQLLATGTDPDQNIGMAGYKAPAGLPESPLPRTTGLLSRQDFLRPEQEQSFSALVNSNIESAPQQAATILEPLRLIASTPPPPQVSAVITPELGSAGWGKALGQQISWMVAGTHQTAELHLHPADLGPLQVVLSVENNQAELMFVSREPAVREAIEAAMPQLKQMLSEAGIGLGQTSVSADSPRGQSDFGNREQRGMNRDEQRLAGNEEKFMPAAESHARHGMGLVDTFA
jgi:flagellar hook-length control protein FliK